MKKIRKDAKTFELNLVNGYRGEADRPILNMDSIPMGEDGCKSLSIELKDGISVTVREWTDGDVYVSVDEMRLTNRESLSITKHKRTTFPADEHTAEFDSTILEARGNKVQVCFKTFHKPLKK